MNMPLRPGDPAALGRYELVGRLGEGGMGTVFLARGPEGRPVAIKMVRPEFAHETEFRGRFRSEVNRAKQVPPFSTAEVLDADPDHEPPYLVVEYVDGPSLAAEIKAKGPLSEAAVHGVAVGIATALTAIHGAGVIHRDLKPGNVLFARGGIKVIDFGIARAFEATSQHTRTDQLVGTVAYMAPERFDPVDGRPVTAAADIFAWGAVVAFAATGRTPFAADSAPATAMRILTQEPDLTRVPFSLRGAVERALAKEPGDRPTARELLDLLLAGATPVLPPALAGPTVPTPALPAPASPAASLTAPAQPGPVQPSPVQPGPEHVPDDAPVFEAGPPVRPRRRGRTLAVATTAVAVVLAASAGVLIRNDVLEIPAASSSTPVTSSPAAAPSATTASPARTPTQEERLASIRRGKNRTLIHAAEIDRDLAYDSHYTEVEAGDGTGAKSEFALIPMGVDYLIRALYDPNGEEVCLGVRLDPEASGSLVGTECAATKGTLFELGATALRDDKNRPRFYLYNDNYGFLQWDPTGGVEGTGAFFVEHVGDAPPLTTFSFVDRGPLPSPAPSR
jgi:serine/threonine protein kinase